MAIAMLERINMIKYNHLVSLVSQLVEYEDREPGVREEIKKALKKLIHSLNTKNIKEIRTAVDKLSEKLLK